MIKYFIIFGLCVLLAKDLKLKVLAFSVMVCLGISYLINSYTDSIQLIVMCTHFSVIFVSLLLLFIYGRDLTTNLIYGSSLILTLISYTAWQYPMLIVEPLNMLILRYFSMLGLELGLLILLFKESFKSFRGTILLTAVIFVYISGYL